MKIVAKYRNWWLVGFVVAAMLPWQAISEGVDNLDISNRLRVEYDDNIRSTTDNKQDSLKVIERLNLDWGVRSEQTVLNLAYRPTFLYWADRDDDETDLHHSFDGSIRHTVSSRLSVNIDDTLRLTERPELIDRGSVIRQENDFSYNSLRGSLNYSLREATQAQLVGRHNRLAYEDDDVAARKDYEITVGGVTLRHVYNPSTTVSANLRTEALGYSNSSRDSDTVYLGAGASHRLSDILSSSVNAGYQSRDFDNAYRDSNDAPYGEASLTFSPTPQTQVSTGVSHSQYEADVFPYASRERTRVHASLAHAFTGRITGFLTLAHSENIYNGMEVPAGFPPIPDGEEETKQVSARVTYNLNQTNRLDAGWQFTDLSSDLRQEFERNRLHVGWVIQL